MVQERRVWDKNKFWDDDGDDPPTRWRKARAEGSSSSITDATSRACDLCVANTFYIVNELAHGVHDDSSFVML